MGDTASGNAGVTGRGGSLRVLAFDADRSPFVPARGGGDASEPAGYLDADEAVLLRELERAGVALVLFTAGSARAARDMCAAAGIHPDVLSDEAVTGGSADVLTRSAARAHALAQECDKALANFQETCVIATHPADAEAMLEAGCALVVAGAGYRACAGADAVFDRREAGGLAQALAYVLAGLQP